MRVSDFWFRGGLVAWLTLLAVAVSCPGADAAVKVRVYPMGESDAGAAIGGNATATTDVQMPPTTDADGDPVSDSQGDFVDLTALFDLPTYAEGRTGAGSLALDFDGVDDTLQSPPFDPRNFSTFASLSQAWVKPDSAKMGTEQFLWSLGNDNGGVGITADGAWQIAASSGVPDTPSLTEQVDFDEWTHVAIFRGGNSATLYVNGRVAATGGATWGGTGDVTVGARTSTVSDLGGDYFDGVIDDFNIAGFSDFTLDDAVDLDFFADTGVTFSGVTGDVDQDGDADRDDYLIWSANAGFDNKFGAGDPGTLLLGDVDGNGRINFFDFNVIATAAAAAGNPLVGVPEPSSMILLLLGGYGYLAAGGRTRRRAGV